MSIPRYQPTEKTGPRIATDAFLAVMSNVAASVAVVTTTRSDGTPSGLTVSDFCSVSLDPPLVLVSVAEASGTLTAIRESQAFTLNFLAHGTEDVARTFAASHIDRFAAVEVTPPSLPGAGPILADYVTAYFECALSTEVVAGDHRILIGLVTEGKRLTDDLPLVYHRRRFVELPPDSALSHE